MPISNRILPAALLFFSIACLATLPFQTSRADAEFSATDAAGLYDTETTYTIVRKGNNIGTHSLSFSQSEAPLVVTAKSNIKVTALKIPVFRFNYQSTENWQSDRLVSVESTAKTGKKTEKSSLQNYENKSQVSYTDTQGNTKQESAARIDYATNHWNINAVQQSILFNTIKGVASNVVITNHGQKTIEINGTSLNTTHYEYTGDLQVESWYDQNNRWVKLLFLGSDGSEISYTIDTP